MNPISIEVPVVIAGGGPVGMTLALDLASRGVRCLLLEARRDIPPNPRCNTTNARSMEILRRLGCAEDVRRAGLPSTHNTDVLYMTEMNGHELARFERPTAQSVLDGTPRGIGADWPTPEPQHFISQLYMEPVLRRHAARQPAIDLRLGWMLTGLVQDADGVTVQAQECDGEGRLEIRCQYLVGTDGANSVVRREIGARLQGLPEVSRAVSVFFKSPRLTELSRAHPAWMYRFPGNSVLVAIDGVDEWLMHTQVLPGDDLETVDPEPKMFAAVGEPFEYQVVNVSRWVARAMVATKYVEGRVFLAGDAAHIWVPMGGFGMNAGVGDADALGWRLAGVLQGWLDRKVFASYESERKSLGSAVAGQAPAWLADLWPLLFADAATWDQVRRDPEVRTAFGERIRSVNRTEWESVGLQLGFSYVDSPVVAADGAPPPFHLSNYRESSVPGVRAPHLWRDGDGRTALFDDFGPGFTLLRIGDAPPRAAALVDAAHSRGVPLKVLDVPEAEAVRKYEGHGLVLVRPDQHIVWRSRQDLNAAQAQAVLDRVCGRLVPEPVVHRHSAKRLSGGFCFPEGLRWRDGVLYFSDMPGCQVHRYDIAAAALEVIAQVPQQPNGLAFLPDGRLLIASMFDAALYTLEAGGLKPYADLSAVVEGYLGDMLVDAKGRIYVDDVGARVLHGEPPAPGRVVRLDPDGRLSTVLDGIRFPNGIGLTPDGQALILGETLGARMLQCRVLEDGSLGSPQTFVDLTVAGHGFGCDGLTMDAQGGVWACLPEAGMVERYDGAGRLTARVHDIPGMPIACALDGEGRTLYVVGCQPLPEGLSIFQAIAQKRTVGWLAAVDLQPAR